MADAVSQLFAHNTARRADQRSHDPDDHGIRQDAGTLQTGITDADNQSINTGRQGQYDQPYSIKSPDLFRPGEFAFPAFPQHLAAQPGQQNRGNIFADMLNKAAAEISFAGQYGHQIGRTMRCERERKVMGDSIFSHILAYTSAACDARMAGAMIPVMSNSGSGNQGIAATLPVVVYAEDTYASEEQTIRALALSHLTVIYIKQSLGRLSALCGCVVAATGSSCGITYLMGGGYNEVVSAVKNMIANLTGMICDGAKPSCSMKLTSGVSTAVLSAMMAMDGQCVTSVEGIIEEDVDRSIRNLTRIGRDGMNETDRMVLDIMTHKC